MGLYRNIYSKEVIDAFQYTGTEENKKFIKRKLVDFFPAQDKSITDRIVDDMMNVNDHIIIYGALWNIVSDEVFKNEYEAYTVTPEDENRSDRDKINQTISSVMGEQNASSGKE